MASPPTADAISALTSFFRTAGIEMSLPSFAHCPDLYSDIICSILHVDLVEPVHIVCTLTVNRTVVNPYNTLHGGVVASLSQVMSLACAKTVAGDIELFLGEMNTSYLSAARINDKVEVETSILRQGRKMIVASVEFRNKTN